MNPVVDGGVAHGGWGTGCVFVGDELLASQCAEIAREHGLDPVALLSANEQVIAHARELGITAVDVAPDDDLRELLGAFEFDILFSVANQRIIPAAVLGEQTKLAINFHDGILPDFGGLNVTTWSIHHGSTAHGVTWHVMEELADRGEIVLERRFEILPDDTALSLNARCYEAGLATFGEVAARVASGAIDTQPQPDGVRRMFRRTDRPIIVVEPEGSAAELARSIRAIDTGPRVRRAMGSAHCRIAGRHVVLNAVRATPIQSGRSPGTVAVEGGELSLTLSDGDLIVGEVTDPQGRRVDPGDVVGAATASLERLSESDRAALAEHDARMCANEAWWARRLVDVVPATGPLITMFDPQRDVRTVVLDSPVDASPSDVGAAVLSWFQAVEGSSSVSLGVSDVGVRSQLAQVPFVQPPVITIGRLDEMTISESSSLMAAEVAIALERGPWLEDLVGRDPELRGRERHPSVLVHFDVTDADIIRPPARTVALEVLIATDGLVSIRHRFDSDTAQRVCGQLEAALASVEAGGTNQMDRVDVISDIDRAQLDGWNETSVDHDRTRTIDGMFRTQVERTPHDPAASCGSETLTYDELRSQVIAMAELLRSAGVERGDVVGIALDRSLDMLVSVLGILSVGGHYLPLDPAYPSDRLLFMVTDSGADVVVGDRRTIGIGDASPELKFVDPAGRRDADTLTESCLHEPSDLAYVIYTSGSTGTPKGVLIEHRQVVNFFTAMDQVVGSDSGRQVWLAVTSLSFDISVLELLWPLTNGGHVVIKPESGFAVRPDRSGRPASGTGHGARRRSTGTDMSLFFFAADAAQADNGYRLLMDSARWADDHDFAAVWTPERHFHQFGAPYPNPSVIGAALAASTERVAIRAGSVVAPLHSPIRIAEEWAVVDNLSGGRVGISFAAGWQPDDFVLNPAAYASARDSLPAIIDTVQRLWRGETVELPGHDGSTVAVATLPRPVQPILPVWLTSAGNPASFERAGSLGYNVLTHLIGQTLEQLGENIERYRLARSKGGHVGDGSVTLMLHSYLHPDSIHARAVAREPLKGYLGTAVGLLKDMASAFPTFGSAGADADEAFRSLTADELSQLLGLAADRYLSTAGLFGSVDDAVSMARSVVDVGVDEIACLIDFGIADDDVLAGLPLLDEVRRRLEVDVERPGGLETGGDNDRSPAAPRTVGELIAHHGVTHLQCTPSLASMLMADTDDRAALRSIDHMMIGGEALPPSLASQLIDIVPGRVTNMYGPTETTIWSLVHEVDRDAIESSSVPIGTPIANTTMLVLDSGGRRMPVGVFGELHLGGEGVTRGYHCRPELTLERFVDRAGLGRVYATGDVVRIRPDGVVEFGGRTDGQVKIRGHRIELAEIEAVIDSYPEVARSVVTATDADEPFLIAHVEIQPGSRMSDPTEIRHHVRSALPEAMVPSAIVPLDALPLTPNGKIDRARLPPPDLSVAAGPVAGDDATTDSESIVAEIWSSQLGRSVSRNDNFFDVGGHSLLAVKVFRELTAAFGPELALTDVFRFPTVATFAAHVEASADTVDTDAVSADAHATAVRGSGRGEMRRRARGRRPVGDV